MSDPASLLPPGRSAERPCHSCGELAYLTVSGEWRHMTHDPAHDVSFQPFDFNSIDPHAPFLGDRRFDPLAPYAEALRKKFDQDMGAHREES